MNPRLIDSIRNAWVEGLEEFLSLSPVAEKSLTPNLLQVIANIRLYDLLREGKAESFVRRVYDDIRSLPDFHHMFMSATTTFVTQLDDVDKAIDYFCARVDVYTENTQIVDSNLKARRAPTGALATLLKDNLWLFMVLVASVHNRDTIAVMVRNGFLKTGAKV